MKNKIIFTQDIEGERLWLSNHFPNYKNLETIFGGKWRTDQPQEGNEAYLYEISFKDYAEDLSFFDIKLPKIKSIYSNNRDDLFFSKWWSVSDDFIHDLTFENKVKSNNFIILNLTRSGTMFTKSILVKKFNEFMPHQSVGSIEKNIELAEIIKNNDLTVFFVFRKNVWQWCTSNIIASHFGYTHYNTIDKIKFTPITAAEDALDLLLSRQMATWNFWCNLKCYLPNLNCYLLEFSNIIENYSSLTDHASMPYKKNEIIKNYNQIKEIFDNKYRLIFDTIIKNGSNHLLKMKCKTDLTDLDLFAK